MSTYDATAEAEAFLMVHNERPERCDVLGEVPRLTAALERAYAAGLASAQSAGTAVPKALCVKHGGVVASRARNCTAPGCSSMTWSIAPPLPPGGAAAATTHAPHVHCEFCEMPIVWLFIPVNVGSFSEYGTRAACVEHREKVRRMTKLDGVECREVTAEPPASPGDRVRLRDARDAARAEHVARGEPDDNGDGEAPGPLPPREPGDATCAVRIRGYWLCGAALLPDGRCTMGHGVRGPAGAPKEGT